MRYIGLDLGTASLGVAISDKSNILVSPLTLIKFSKENYQEALVKLLPIIAEYQPKAIVLGLPKNMDNSLGFAAQRSLNFKKKLEEKGLSVILEDERLTTVEAINIMKQNGVKKINTKNKTDVLSAILILESYLKRMNNERK